MRILVTGDRNWTDEAKMEKAFDEVYAWFPQLSFETVTIIEGEARGADLMARRWAEEHKIAVEPYPADWGQSPRAAGVIRNQQMLDTGVDLCLAFHRDLRESRGTADMVQRCLRAKVLVWLYS